MSDTFGMKIVLNQRATISKIAEYLRAARPSLTSFSARDWSLRAAAFGRSCLCLQTRRRNYVQRSKT